MHFAYCTSVTRCIAHPQRASSASFRSGVTVHRPQCAFIMKQLSTQTLSTLPLNSLTQLQSFLCNDFKLITLKPSAFMSSKRSLQCRFIYVELPQNDYILRWHQQIPSHHPPYRERVASRAYQLRTIPRYIPAMQKKLTIYSSVSVH